MNVTIISAFRNACHYLERYCEQMDRLQALLHKRGDSLRLLLGYGDSTDGTAAALFDECSNRFCAHLIDVSHGGPIFQSIEDPQRFKQLAYVGNRLLDCVQPSADVVGIVESDLIWGAETLWQLIDMVATKAIIAPPSIAIAPMVMDGPDSFYDVFAFRRGGVRFTKTPPYHADLPASSANGFDYLEIDSAGSVLFMDGELARSCRFSEEEAIVGLCKEITAHDGTIWLDANATVYHP